MCCNSSSRTDRASRRVPPIVAETSLLVFRCVSAATDEVQRLESDLVVMEAVGSRNGGTPDSPAVEVSSSCNSLVPSSSLNLQVQS
ncbi:hypothetical protein CLOM_g21003 [Closterium sp. NIES-68]|nr:hypothetical protein CLOM_g21003 [Closterium sp. NIES-68]GJP71144.1 hypothetical protein CLOP_g1992 [Closterium sp. NIES-67]